MNTLPPILVISLPGSSRRPAMSRRLASWRGTWSFLDATDGEALGSAELAAVYCEADAMRAYGRPLSRAEIGCALSHRRAYESILAQGVGAAIVLEDDAELSPFFMTFAAASIDLDFDVVALYTSSALVRRRPERVVAGVALHRAAGGVTNTVGYVVSRRGAGRLLQATGRICRPADWPVFPQDLAFYVSSPPQVWHDTRDSRIESGRREAIDRKHRYKAWTNWFTQGPVSNLSIPLFIKYLCYRECYAGVLDYCRREIEPELKRWLSMVYRTLSQGR